WWLGAWVTFPAAFILLVSAGLWQFEVNCDAKDIADPWQFAIGGGVMFVSILTMGYSSVWANRAGERIEDLAWEQEKPVRSFTFFEYLDELQREREALQRQVGLENRLKLRAQASLKRSDTEIDMPDVESADQTKFGAFMQLVSRFRKSKLDEITALSVTPEIPKSLNPGCFAATFDAPLVPASGPSLAAYDEDECIHASKPQ
ncbi:hypothetical protein CYMTET_18192, partial [Cymbomonas tetramitiformis]